MRDRIDLMNRRKKTIENLITEYCEKQGKELCCIEIAEELFKSKYISLTCPQEEPPMMQMIVMSSINNFHKAESIKAGNITLNIKNLIKSLPELVMSGVSVLNDITILKICSALIIWKNLYKASTVEISKEQAIIINVLWNNCDERHQLSVEEGFDRANSLCRQISFSEFTWEKYIKILEQLEGLKCIEQDMDGIWLREWVVIPYKE